MTRSVPVLLAAAVAVSLVPAASAAAPAKVGIDRAHGVRFQLKARTLRVFLEPVDGAANPLLTELPGVDVDVACSGHSPTSGKKVLASALSNTWPATGNLLKVRLNRDASDKVAWCLIEHHDTGADIAYSPKMRVPKPVAAPSPAPKSSSATSPTAPVIVTAAPSPYAPSAGPTVVKR
ncbi:MAG: hypothetical protein REI11_08690 [Patulibacter sp.]|nr:hypothetical protein [Patulibacter sp.]